MKKNEEEGLKPIEMSLEGPFEVQDLACLRRWARRPDKL
jgi:hypothetical protein